MKVLRTIAGMDQYPDGWMRTVRLNRIQAHDLYHDLQSLDMLPDNRKQLAQFMTMAYLDVRIDGDITVRVTWGHEHDLEHDTGRT